MGIATFAGNFDANNRCTYCGYKNLLNALRRGNTHTGVLGVDFSLFIDFQTLKNNLIWKFALILTELV